MGISQYLREIGRGKDGARSLDRVQARDLFDQLLDGRASDLEIGAFCIAMRVKGETPEEMAGFIEASYGHMDRVPGTTKPIVVLPSYNGARKLPLLTPLLALLLQRQELPVLIHGAQTESTRVFVDDVLALLEIRGSTAIRPIVPGQLLYVPTRVLSPGLHRLLEVRRTIGLRNSSHSLVKLMNPCLGEAVIVGSYTHPEYAASMAAVFELTGATAMLLRGTEGEPVADPRRQRKIEGFFGGRRELLQEEQAGSVTELPDLPAGTDARATAAYIQDVLAGKKPLPTPIALQVEHILRLATAKETTA